MRWCRQRRTLPRPRVDPFAVDKIQSRGDNDRNPRPCQQVGEIVEHGIAEDDGRDDFKVMQRRGFFGQRAQQLQQQKLAKYQEDLRAKAKVE